jgi:hypothetical protein
MELDYVQEKIGYNFVNLPFLISALEAAEKDNLKGEYRDGNRGLSTMGVCAVDMVTTRNMILRFNGTKSRRCARFFSCILLRQLGDVHTIKHWSKSKRGRASACISLGLDRCVVQSVRQSHVEPSETVLAYTLSAIIGAVWFDLERYVTGLEMMNRISEILARIDTLIQREALQSNDSVASGADFETIHPSVFLRPFDQFQGMVHDSNRDVADALIGSIQSIDTMRFDSAAAENNNNNNTLLESEGIIEDTCQGNQIGNHIVAGTHQVSSDTTKNPETAIALDSRGRSQEHRRALHKISLHERLVREELAKLRSPPSQLHENLKNLLDHDGIDGATTHKFQASQLRLLYFAIGSCQSLRGFKEALHLARASPGYICHPSRHALSCAERYQTICRLDDTERLCILLRRFHIVKLFEEELEVLYPSNMIIVETPSSFVKRQTAEMGNPAVRRKAALTDAVLRKIKPELQEGTPEYKKCRTELKQMRRLAEMLGILTGTYGYGILALLPSKPAYSECSPLEVT